MKQVPYRNSTNIRHHLTKFSREGHLAAVFVKPSVVTARFGDDLFRSSVNTKGEEALSCKVIEVLNR